ncbi:hypothetical protein OSTOST_01189 [Ostertagia ostertagi]
MGVLHVIVAVFLLCEYGGKAVGPRPFPRRQPPPPVLSRIFIPPPPPFPRDIPRAPGGERNCPVCPFISTVKCRRGRTNCVEPLVTYRRRGCSGTATIHCKAPGSKTSLDIKLRANWQRVQSSTLIRQKVLCRRGRWYTNNGLGFSKNQERRAPLSRPRQAPLSRPPQAPPNRPPQAPQSQLRQAPLSRPPQAPPNRPPQVPLNQLRQAPLSRPPQAPPNRPPQAPQSQPRQAPLSRPPQAPPNRPPQVPLNQPRQAPLSRPPQAPPNRPPQAPQRAPDRLAQQAGCGPAREE